MWQHRRDHQESTRRLAVVEDGLQPVRDVAVRVYRCGGRGLWAAAVELQSLGRGWWAAKPASRT